MINIGNSVGMGNANFNGQSSASGASTGMNFDLNLGGGAQPTLMLMNLAADADYIDGFTCSDDTTCIIGSKNWTKKTVVTNFRFGDEVLNFTVAPGESRTFKRSVKHLMNLADSYMKNFDSFGDVAFQGGGAGMHTIDNMRGNVGSTTTFSI